jgi:hypothetical protein
MNEELNMKSYKDLDKDIILNAPEGATWWYTTGQFYYRLNNGKIEYTDLEDEDGWQLSDDYSSGVGAIQNHNHYVIPLPNVEIPWEATEDSKCPVSDDTVVKLLFYPNRVNDWTKALPASLWNWGGSFTSYKIIDEDYLPSVATVTITEDSATIEPGVVVTVYETVEDKLTKRLEFLQNIANKFPEIRNEVIKFMECELDGYMNTLWEKDNDE